MTLEYSRVYGDEAFELGILDQCCFRRVKEGPHARKGQNQCWGSDMQVWEKHEATILVPAECSLARDIRMRSTCLLSKQKFRVASYL